MMAPMHNMALILARSAGWALRPKAAQRRLAPRCMFAVYLEEVIGF